MSQEPGTELKLYHVTNRTTGERWLAITFNADDACKQADWLVGDCYVHEVTECRGHSKAGESPLKVNIPCRTCPFQYAECKKPDEADCPLSLNTPDLNEWLKQAATAHLCLHVGQDLTMKDYNLNQKWVTLAQAIEELAPKS